ncbi:abortive infection family protein [Pseudomonas aeruginosa]|uniref:abortive infection family protein n=1 Tax=Pseudomonas aeruginosa TaxID=287 RepID=UPI001ABE865A|nr:abortive infection family protein [Pseudomonas aeruginosa]MBO3780394.1 abortive infection family protein [Pseudomonas aeruginosa]MBX5979553.1 abortive infection family protein [Pseudomonas aeruginosa]MDP5658046.1 abortive infection family protein [Pseudomonas aeruginosa]HBO0245213.1 abortive infection family protein [Pseudomonas aeruginosa]HBP1524238.1 abortive infection family protein [Pseudomonas aeruginosa]
MTLLLHEVLRKVKTGAKSFCPQSDARGDLDKFQAIAKTVVYAYEQGYISRIIPRMESVSGQTYYTLVLVDGGLTFEGESFLDQLSGQPTPADEELVDLLTRIQSYNIRDRWEKALSRRVTDPSGAITAARSLLETTLKWIIEERGGKPIENNRALFNRAIDALGIAVKGQPVERTIEGLSSIIWGIGEMRNRLGDAHGAVSDSALPTVSEAGLCVNLAGATALFLLEEFEASQAKYS